MKREKRKKFYAVKCGRRPGIYTTWDECEMQVKYYSGARFKSFSSRKEAERYMKTEVKIFERPDSEIGVTTYKNGVRVG